MENQESSQTTEVVENVESEFPEIISNDLKELYQFMKDNKIESDELIELEKQEIIQNEILQKELEEQQEIEKIEQQEIDLLTEQAFIDSENEFRTNLIDSVSLQNEKMDTYIQKSDGLAESVESLNQTTSILVDNTQITDKEMINQEVAYYSGLALLVVVMIFIPSFIMVKFFMSLFRHII